MKSLLDIQQEIRDLDRKVKEISTTISEIYDEIDDLRNNETDTMDYEMIHMMSNHFRFGKHPLDKLNDAYACQLYLEILINLTQTDDGAQSTISRLIFIQWILNQSRLDISLEELFKDSLKFNSASFSEMVEIIPKSYHSYLVMDALITANICGIANDNILLYVVNLSNILGFEKEKIRILSIIARGVLKQNLGKINKTDLEKVLDWAKYFKHYLKEDTMIKVIHSQRVLVVEAPDNNSYRNFKWKVKQQSHVNKGDVIATYGYYGNWAEIKASCDGIIFQFRNNCINYGVIAHKSDSKDSIKAWVLKKG